MNPDPAPDQSALPAVKPRRRRFRPFRLLFILTGLFILALLLAMFIPGLEFERVLVIGGKPVLAAKRYTMTGSDGSEKIDSCYFSAGPVVLLLHRILWTGTTPSAFLGPIPPGGKFADGCLFYAGDSFLLMVGCPK